MYGCRGSGMPALLSPTAIMRLAPVAIESESEWVVWLYLHG